ncbi:hypothetical protein [Amycolatopsis sp. BJA-103]|uniref:hypothetical protein n=1 Tax=Amycolatopsis sp. BJA-103 TaxID=1911175 RepID=UPI0011AECE19|nr:hypothetical protein [Amycolatopsis sp. BJA-103]
MHARVQINGHPQARECWVTKSGNAELDVTENLEYMPFGGAGHYDRPAGRALRSECQVLDGAQRHWSRIQPSRIATPAPSSAPVTRGAATSR